MLRWILRQLARLITDAGVWVFMVLIVVFLLRVAARWMVFPGCTPYLHRQTDKELSVRLRRRLDRGLQRSVALSQVGASVVVVTARAVTASSCLASARHIRLFRTGACCFKLTSESKRVVPGGSDCRLAACPLCTFVHGLSMD